MGYCSTQLRGRNTLWAQKKVWRSSLAVDLKFIDVGKVWLISKYAFKVGPGNILKQLFFIGLFSKNREESPRPQNF